MTRSAILAAAGATLLALLLACGPRGAHAELETVPHPDMSALEETSRTAIEAAVGALDGEGARTAAAWGDAGRIYHAHRFNDAAAACYRNAALLDPSDATWPYLLGHVLSDGGSPAEAEAAFSRAIALSPQDSAAHYWLGEALERSGRVADAEAAWRRSLELDETNAAAMAALARVALDRGAPAEAEQLLRRAIALQRDANKLEHSLARALREQGRVDEARERLELAGEGGLALRDPRMEAVRALATGSRIASRRGADAARAGRLDLAAEWYRKAVDAAPRDASAHANLGTVLARLGQREEGERQLREALTLAPDDALASAALGTLLAFTGRDAEAVDLIRRGAVSRPSREAHADLADVMLRLGRHEEAAAELAGAIALEPAHVELRTRHAVVLGVLGRWREAYDTLSPLVTPTEANVDAAGLMARILAAAPDESLRDPKRAMDLAKGAYAVDQTGDQARALAIARAAAGDFEGAVDMQRRLLKSAEQQSLDLTAAALREDLRRFEAGKTAAAPWGADEAALRPTPRAP